MTQHTPIWANLFIIIILINQLEKLLNLIYEEI